MGTKFANLHIKSTNQAYIVDALQWLSNAAGSVLAGANHTYGDIIEQYLYRETKQNGRSASSVSFYINQGSDWTSILNDQFSWGLVEKIGELLSTFVSEPVMTIGFFDEDVFEFTVFQEGEIRTKNYFCKDWAIEEYGLESEVVDHEYLQKVLDLTDNKLNKLLEINNPEQAVDELTRLTKLYLWMHSDWMKEDKEFEERYRRLDLEIKNII